MISMKDYEGDLTNLGNEYFINQLHLVPDIVTWARENNQNLGEPHMPMKLIARPDNSLVMIVQSKISEEMLSDVIKNLSMRWSVKDNVTDMEKRLNSTKKRLAYCFLKEYARSTEKVEGDELSEDEWVIEEMEYLGFFEE